MQQNQFVWRRGFFLVICLSVYVAGFAVTFSHWKAYLKYTKWVAYIFSCLWSLFSSSDDNLCKQFGPRSGPTFCRSWSGSKPSDTLIEFLKYFFLNWKKWADENISMKNYPACTVMRALGSLPSAAIFDLFPVAISLYTYVNDVRDNEMGEAVPRLNA